MNKWTSPLSYNRRRGEGERTLPALAVVLIVVGHSRGDEAEEQEEKVFIRWGEERERSENGAKWRDPAGSIYRPRHRHVTCDS